MGCAQHVNMRYVSNMRQTQLYNVRDVRDVQDVRDVCDM
jgi:hypothetical protein